MNVWKHLATMLQPVQILLGPTSALVLMDTLGMVFLARVRNYNHVHLCIQVICFISVVINPVMCFVRQFIR